MNKIFFIFGFGLSIGIFIFSIAILPHMLKEPQIYKMTNKRIETLAVTLIIIELILLCIVIK